jgi:ATP-dependent Clp protease adaptor protein ClpS
MREKWAPVIESGLVVAEVNVSIEVKKPSMYLVILMNDDFTPMDFVVKVLREFFTKTFEMATLIMLQVHYQGRGVCGVYTREIAETKVALVNAYARDQDYPLLCTMVVA